ncbi:sensor histidine kinase [Paenibacillus koleovorans]|uniref:sensor histidine kinase n=1 Tax=Paenibacillus koleovorans TaxID=121608 RepID=UPI000FD77B2C|nr:sensor histidine kinase [Paenibacillus koleovorans]
MSIAKKVFWFSFVLVECIILLLGWLFYSHASKTLYTVQTENAKQMVRQTEEYLQLNLKSVQNFILSIANDTRIREDRDEELAPWLNQNLIFFMPNVRNIHVLRDSIVVSSTSPYGWLIESNPNIREVLAASREIGSPAWLTSYYNEVSDHTVTVIMKIQSNNGSTIAIVVDLNLFSLHASLEANRSQAGPGQLLLLDPNNEPITGNSDYSGYNVFTRHYELKNLSPDLFSESWTNIRIRDSDNKLFLARSRNNILDWQLVWIIDETELLEPLGRIVRYAFWLTTVSLFLSIAAAYTLAIYFGKPIRRIAASMDLVSNGRLDVILPDKRKDELGLLSRHFNRMTIRIQALIADVQRTEKQRQEADFRALQAQIRPHFLYNTLNAISIASREQRSEDADSLISSLTTQLQYALEDSPAPVTMEEEWTAVLEYIFLMQSRYPDKINFSSDIDPYTLTLMLPKFTLQPIVENAIFHGLAVLPEGGVLFVATVLHEDWWEIIIEDDGAGMEESATLYLQALDGSCEGHGKSISIVDSALQGVRGHGIGFSNVKQRLALLYGDRFVLQVNSSPGKGTRIIMEMPIRIVEKRRDFHAQSHDS